MWMLIRRFVFWLPVGVRVTASLEMVMVAGPLRGEVEL